jgi:hypothetical protein
MKATTTSMTTTTSAAIHVIVENQVAMGNEAPVAATVERLIAQGLTRHQAIHAVGRVLAAGLFDLLKGSGDADEFSSSYYAALGELTAEGWLQYGGDDDLDFGDPDDELGEELEGILTAGEEDDLATHEGHDHEHDHDHECGDPHCGHEGVTVRRESPKVGRNDPCPCGSGKKFKKCCLANTAA